MMASLTKIEGFDKEAFEKVHASGEQVTSVRLNPQKVLNVKRETADMKLGISPIKNDEGKVSPSFTFDVSRFTPGVLPFTSSIPWCPHGLYLPERPSFTFDPLFHAGAYYVQEASSMFLWEVLRQTVGDNTAGAKVLDLCAAPGGKSTLLASYFKDGLVVANDTIRSRAAVLAENITKWGSANTVVSNNDPKAFAKLESYFDVMVIDAPCSGSGLFRRDEDAISEWSEENVLLCSQRQQRIIADAYNALKKDGILIYSTCSYSQEEDEQILDWLCEEFEIESLKLSINQEWGIVETASDKHKAHGYRFYPYKLKGEGFFISAFKKNDGREVQHHAQGVQKSSKEEVFIASMFINKPAEFFYIKQAESIVAIPLQWAGDITVLQKNLYLRKAGITIGTVKGKDLIPGHELAMSAITADNLPVVSLSKEQAIQYLQKKEVPLNNLEKGWTLAKYNGINLGWLKVLHNRVNNYYPVEWRILKEKP